MKQAKPGHGSKRNKKYKNQMLGKKGLRKTEVFHVLNKTVCITTL